MSSQGAGLSAAQVQQAWRLLNPAAGEHLSQLELSQNGQAVLQGFLQKDAAMLTGPSGLLTLKQLNDILESVDLQVGRLFLVLACARQSSLCSSVSLLGCSEAQLRRTHFKLTVPFVFAVLLDGRLS